MRKTTIGVMLLMFSLSVTGFCKSPKNAEEPSLSKVEKGSFEDTIKDANKAIELNPKDAEAYYNRGTAKGSLGDRIGSMKDFNKAIELKPKYSQAYYSRGFLKNKLGDHTGAMKDFNKVVTLDPKGAIPYYSRGVTKNQLGDKKGALEDLSKAGELGYSESYEMIRKIQSNDDTTGVVLNNLVNDSLDQKAAPVEADYDTNKLFAPVSGRYGFNPSLAFSHGGGTTSLSFSLGGEFFVANQVSFLTNLGIGYANSTTSATSVTFLGGFRFYALKEARAIPYFQVAGGLMYLSSGSASATAAVVSPGVGLMIPINSYTTVNIDVNPAIVFNNGANFYIYTTIGMGFWF